MIAQVLGHGRGCGAVADAGDRDACAAADRAQRGYRMPSHSADSAFHATVDIAVIFARATAESGTPLLKMTST